MPWRTDYATWTIKGQPPTQYALGRMGVKPYLNFAVHIISNYEVSNHELRPSSPCFQVRPSVISLMRILANLLPISPRQYPVSAKRQTSKNLSQKILRK